MADRRLDFKELADAALDRADRLVPDWLPQGRLDGHEWRCGNVRGDPGRSLAVNLKTGVWADFSSDEKGGDLVSLYAAIFTGNNQGQAGKELADILHLPSAGTSAHTPPKRSQPALPDESAADREKRGSPWTPVVPVPADVGPAPVAHPVRGHPAAVWTYKDRAGLVLGHIYRFTTSDGGKEVLPCVWARDSRSGRAEWRWMQFAVPRPLYGLWEDAGRDYVLIVEGEKCRDAAQAECGGWADVLSWPGGGKAVSKADWEPLRGRKVIIWPDCDAKMVKDGTALLPVMPEKGRQTQPGVKAAEDVAQILLGLDCVVRLVDIPAPLEKPDGWDVADAVAEGLAGDALRAWIFDRLRLSIHAAAAVPADGPRDIPPDDPAPGPAGAGDRWRAALLRKPRGGFEDCKENVSLTLEHHPDLQGLVGYNEFAARIEKMRTTPWGSSPGEWTEEDDLELSMWLSTRADLLFRSTSTIGEGVRLIASRNKHHPVREYLESLRWDGRDRTGAWLTDCLGVAPTEYSILIGKLWLRQAVNRILHPGCKGDYVLILEGQQGLMKSTALRTLGADWFSDAPLDLNSKDAYMVILGTWIYEIAELDAFNRSESTRIKAFLTQANDKFRPPYGSRMVTQQRQTVFAATTNNFEYHKDPTGNRRFWSVLCTRVNLALIREIRDQLFAQALFEVRHGYPVYPSREEEQRLIVPEQQMREIVDPWQQAIAVWVDDIERRRTMRFTSAQILTDAIKMELSKIDGQRSATTRIGSIMARLGWRKGRESSGQREYYYERPAKAPEEPSSSASGVSAGEAHAPASA